MDYHKAQALAATGLSNISNYRPPSNVAFQRHDGIGMVSIGTELTEEAAVELETFLRDLLARDATKLQAQRQIQQEEAVRHQRAQAQGQYAAMNNPSAFASGRYGN